MKTVETIKTIGRYALVILINAVMFGFIWMNFKEYIVPGFHTINSLQCSDPAQISLLWVSVVMTLLVTTGVNLCILTLEWAKYIEISREEFDAAASVTGGIAIVTVVINGIIGSVGTAFEALQGKVSADNLLNMWVNQTCSYSLAGAVICISMYILELYNNR